MEKFDLENFPTSESALKMLSYVTEGFYDKSYVGKWLFQVMGIEYDAARQIAEELPDQFFPETATWGLAYHEIKWGLPVRENLQYEERRRLIYQKRDYRAPMTPYRMERHLEDATGFEVHIADANDPGEYGYDAPHPNVFKAYFLGEGTLDSKKVHEILDRLKQSHTAYIINDRIEFFIDCINLEQTRLKNITFRVCVLFWNTYIIFDGSWIWDGTVTLNAERRYGLATEIKFLQRFYELMDIKLNALKYMWTQLFHSKLNAKIVCYSGIIEEPKQRGAVRLCVDIDMSRQERLENVAVETKTEDYWFFDGTVCFDGSRKFNSIYRKEIVE